MACPQRLSASIATNLFAGSILAAVPAAKLKPALFAARLCVAEGGVVLIYVYAETEDEMLIQLDGFGFLVLD